MWDSGWDSLFSRVEWGKYPGEELIRFVARKFYSAPDRRAVRLLEVGCGTGANVWFMAREGFSVDGVDGSQVALDSAANRLAGEGLHAGFVLGDAMRLPYEADLFDAVIDVECIYANSLADSRKIIAECHRVLKPGGWIYSKTFATGMSGEETAEALPGEPHTYVRMPDAPLHSDYGIIRLTSREEIPVLYGAFSELEVDYIERSQGNQKTLLREWIITGRKAVCS
ncbi:MAG: class I SAM-dependent methyltransferase [Sulfuritalea sp.]|nr:class I SAM-dependent methyltransferase [Sulfuritalea sp.]